MMNSWNYKTEKKKWRQLRRDARALIGGTSANRP
jgi:hypothetical protein